MNMNKPFSLRKPEKETMQKPIKIMSTTPYGYHIIMARTVFDLFDDTLMLSHRQEMLKLELTKKLSEELDSLVEFDVEQHLSDRQSVMTAKLKVFLPEF